ncbi:MAG TPA: phasin family protein [Roseiarcus sp.]|nr:phasin family protein [Roseiarcus sp.]
MPKRLKELADEAMENQVLAQARDLAVKVRDSANQIWLAGLGAFSKAQKGGAEMFEALVAEGEKFQERTKGAADERVAEMREKASETWNKVEKVFDDRVGRALHALNVPTRKDIDVLSRRVHDLTTTTKKLGEEEETHGRGRAHRAKAE